MTGPWAELLGELATALATRMRTVHVQADEEVFAEGAPGDCVFVVEAGEVLVRRGATLLARLGPGELLGEMSLLDRGARGAAAVAGPRGATLSRLEANDFRAELDRRGDGGAAAYRALLTASYARLAAMNRYFVATCRAGEIASRSDPTTATAGLLELLVLEGPGAAAALVLERCMHTGEPCVRHRAGEPFAEGDLAPDDERARAALEPGATCPDGPRPAIAVPLDAGEPACGLLVLGRGGGEPFALAARLLAGSIGAVLGLVTARHRADEEEANRRRLTRMRDTRPHGPL